MRQWIIGVSFGLLMSTSVNAHTIQVFVSFSMPKSLLLDTLQEAAVLKIPVILNGLIENSMPKTLRRVFALSKKIPNLGLLIDPTAFERFGIRKVPALVVSGEHGFDVIYGNVSLNEGLLRIAQSGACGFRGR